MCISPEETGYWYLRLNGFLTIPNFVVHPDEAANQKTDIDVLGVRFPFRSELLRDPMIDEEAFVDANGKPFVVITEIKRGRCQINEILVDPRRDALRRVLRALGAVPLHSLAEVEHNLLERGSYSSETCRITFLCIGAERNQELEESHPYALQVTWNEVLEFIFNRFAVYRGRKANHPQWDGVGQFLWNAASHIRDQPSFCAFIRNVWVASGPA